MTEAEICDLLCLDLPRAEAVRAAAPDGRTLEARAERAKTLGDPTRLAVAVALLEGGDLCVCDLSWIVGRSQKLVSHHARVLRAAGLAASRREGKMVMYRLTDEGAALVRAVLQIEARA